MQELFELADQRCDLHAMHQGPVFQCIKFNCEATAAGHLFFIEKLHGFRISIENFIDPGIFINDHIIQILLPL